MNTFQIASYLAALASFLALTVMLLLSWRRSRQGIFMSVATGVTTCWAGLLILHSFMGALPLPLIYGAESLRGCVWILALLSIAGSSAPRWLRIAAPIFCVGALVALLLALTFRQPVMLVIDPTALAHTLILLVAIFGLLMVEQIYSGFSLAARNSFKHFALGIGAIFAYDVFLYSQALLGGAMVTDSWDARGLFNAIAVPLIAISVRRSQDWSLDLFISRQVVFYGTAAIVVAAYLAAVVLGGYYVSEIGRAWGGAGRIAFFAAAAILLAAVLASGTLRRYARVLISKHLYQGKYDYRHEWLRFIRTLSFTDEEDVRRAAIRAIAQIFSSPAGILFLKDETERAFVPVAAWPQRLESLPQITALALHDELARFMDRTQWIVDTKELRNAPDLYDRLQVPPWLLADPRLRIVAPLLQTDTLAGFIVLHSPAPFFELTYEDRDLLKTVGRHVATYLAQQEADRKLTESRQFEAYNRLTAFLMHDLKNSIAQLKLVVTNSERHKRNPEFIDDAIGTINNAVGRMTRLLEQLRGSDNVERLATLDLATLANEAIERCKERLPRPTLLAAVPAIVRVDPERLTAVIEHIIRNAQDATEGNGRIEVRIEREAQQVRLAVIDTGTGMDARFIRDRLFRPFDSTKQAAGMGIGAYQAREYVQALGGHVEVHSTPGRGTNFSITLPIAAMPGPIPATQAAN